MSTADKKHRSHLPMRNTTRPLFIAYDAKHPDIKPEPIEQLRRPDGTDDCCDIGEDSGAAVPPDYVEPEKAMAMAMTRQ